LAAPAPRRSARRLRARRRAAAPRLLALSVSLIMTDCATLISADCSHALAISVLSQE
jgi:hypothetical protein